MCQNGTYADYNPTYPARQQIALVLLIITPIVAAVFTFLMITRRHLQPLRKRSLGLVLLCALGSLVTTLLRVGLEELLTRPKMLCDVNFFAGMLFTVFTGPPMMLRIIRLYHMFKVQKRKLQAATAVGEGARERFLRLARAVRKAEAWTHPKRLYLVYFFCALPSLIAVVLIYVQDKRYGNGCRNCGRTWGDWMLNFWLGVFYTAGTVWTLYRTRNMVDSFFLRKEILHWQIMWFGLMCVAVPAESVPQLIFLQRDGYFNGETLFLVGALGTLVVSIIMPVLGTYNRGVYAAATHQPLRYHVMNPLATSRFAAYSASTEGGELPMSRLDQLAVNGDEAELDSVELIEVLHHPTGFKSFERHLATEFSVENCKFWSDVNFFRSHFHAGEPGRVAANVMYETYLDEAGPLAVNVSHAQRDAVKNSLNDLAGCTANMLDECQTEIYKLMERDSFPRFRRSGRFSEMIRAIAAPAGALQTSSSSQRCSLRKCCPCFGRCLPKPSHPELASEPSMSVLSTIARNDSVGQGAAATPSSSRVRTRSSVVSLRAGSSAAQPGLGAGSGRTGARRSASSSALGLSLRSRSSTGAGRSVLSSSTRSVTASSGAVASDVELAARGTSR